MNVLYNENESFAVSWLENLISAKKIPSGRVDRRSIEDLAPEDCADTSHFFAGIGGWPYALQLADWPEDCPVWTGSCPCQPFSQAGRRKGFADKRHLWPAWFRLIRERYPPTIFGEQVASPDALRWVDSVFDDLEGEGYTCGAAILPACGVGAPHIRQRLYWVAFSAESRRQGSFSESQQRRARFEQRRSDGRLGHASSARAGGDSRAVSRAQAESLSQRLDAWHLGNGASDAGAVEWLQGEDGKARPIEPGLSPLAHGVSGRVGKLRAYGNAIVSQVAAAFVRAVL